jgi:hypothetical protein
MIHVIQNDIEVYECYCTYGDVEQNIPTLNKFSHGFIPTHILIPYNVGLLNFKLLIIHYAYHCLLLCRYHFGEGEYMNHITKRSPTILINKRTFLHTTSTPSYATIKHWMLRTQEHFIHSIPRM